MTKTNEAEGKLIEQLDAVFTAAQKELTAVYTSCLVNSKTSNDVIVCLVSLPRELQDKAIQLIQSTFTVFLEMEGFSCIDITSTKTNGYKGKVQ